MSCNNQGQALPMLGCCGQQSLSGANVTAVRDFTQSPPTIVPDSSGGWNQFSSDATTALLAAPFVDTFNVVYSVMPGTGLYNPTISTAFALPDLSAGAELGGWSMGRFLGGVAYSFSKTRLVFPSPITYCLFSSRSVRNVSGGAIVDGPVYECIIPRATGTVIEFDPVPGGITPAQFELLRSSAVAYEQLTWISSSIGVALNMPACCNIS